MKRQYSIYLFLIIPVIFLTGNFAIEKAVAQNFISEIQSLSDFYEVPPDLGSCNPGILKDSEKQKALEMINLIRSFHDLKPVAYDYTGDDKASKAAMICVKNGALSHTPPSNWLCYTPEAADGCKNSNLYAASVFGYDYLPTSESSVNSWIKDKDVVECGHRRAIINPFVPRISFGRCDGMPEGKTFVVAGMTLKYMDNLDGVPPEDIPDFIGYPYHDYPPEFFDNNWYLTFSVFYDKTNWWNNDKVDYSQAIIEMKDESNNSISVSGKIFDTDGWGAVINNVAWKVPTLQQHVKYTVNIKNVKVNGQTKDYTYWFRLQEYTPGAPDATTLSSPPDNSNGMDTSLSLAWNSAPRAIKYHLQISKNQDFSGTPAVDIYNDGTTYTSSSLEFATKYYWRVSAKNNAGESSWSPVWSFTTKTPAPLMPLLRYPANGDYNIPTNPNMIWQKSKYAAFYEIQIALSNTFDNYNMIFNQKNISDSAYKLPDSKLNIKTKYFWRVRGKSSGASGPGEDGPWSQPWSFTTLDPSSVDNSIDETEDLLMDNYPNPFDNSTTIEFYLKKDGVINIKIYDIFGNYISTVTNGYFTKGINKIRVDSGILASGTYYLNLSNGLKSISKIIEIIR